MKKIVLILFTYIWMGTFSLSAETLVFALVGVAEGSKAHDITRNLANAIAKRSGVEIILRPLPAIRAKEYLKHGDVDGDFSRVEGFGANIPGLIQLQEPIASHPFNAYAIRSDIKIDGWESLKPYKVLYPRGWKVIEQNLTPFHKKLIPSNRVEPALKFLSDGRADVYINIPFLVDGYIEGPNAKFKNIEPLKPPLEFLHVYTYLLPKHAEIANLMELALKGLKEDGEYNKILGGGLSNLGGY